MSTFNLRPSAIGKALIITTVLVLITCDKSNDITGPNPDPDPAVDPAISLSLSESSLEVVQGESETLTVSVTRTGGFTGAVDLSLEDVPEGVTATFDPASVPAGENESALTLEAAADAAMGESELIVLAQGEGVGDATVTLDLLIEEAEVVEGDYSIILDPESLSLEQGETGEVAVQLQRSDFDGEVALSVSGVPEEVTVNIEPEFVTADEATLTVDVGSGAAPGSYTLTVTGEAEGVDERTAELELTVTEAALTGDWALVSSGEHHTCAVNEAGEMYCWGRNQFGQLGDGTTEPRSQPRLVAGGHAWASVSAGHYHTCGITTAGDGYCWGYGAYGRLGNGSTADSSTPQPVAVSGGDTWQILSAGDRHTCGMTPDGRAYCWGHNFRGQLGDGTSTTRTTRALVVDEHAWQTVSAGRRHTCGVTTTGHAYCWGDRGNGRLGNGASGTAAVRRPDLVQGGHTWAHVAARSAHSCGITTEGDGYCWGSNRRGELGIGDTEDRTTPALILNDHIWVDMEPGMAHTSCGITPTGEAYCWGLNLRGQLGDGTTDNTTAPQPVSGGFTWANVSGGDEHTCGITEAGVAYCWGRGSYGQLGDGTATTTVYPTPRIVLNPQ